MFGGNPDFWRAWREANVSATEPENDLAMVEFDTVTAWRFGYLVGLGFDPDTSLRLAESKDVDLKKAESLVGGGCSLELAVRILL